MKRFYKFLMPLVAIVAMALPWNVQAQVTCDSGSPVTVSNADTATTTSSYFPAYSLYNYSYSEQIIPAEDLAGIGDIKALMYMPTNTTSNTYYDNCEIYLANVSVDDLSAGFVQDMSQFELVYTGSLNWTSAGWNTIVFNSTFSWDGSSNLLIAIRRNHGSWGSSSAFAAYTAEASLAREVHQDSGPYTIGSISGGDAYTAVAWYKFIGCEGSGDFCYRVTNLEASNITSDGFTLSWTDTRNSSASYTIYNMTDTSIVATTSSTTYTFTGLEANTLYHYAVVADCGTSTTSYARIDVRTACGGYTNIPYIEDFESNATGEMPSCWLQASTGTSGSGIFPSIYQYASNTHNGNGYFEFESSNGGQTEIAALPTMQNISGLKLIFWASASSNYPCTLEAGVLEDDSTFVVVDTIDLITFTGTYGWKENYHEYTVYYSSYTGTGERMALRASNTSGQYTLFVDDLGVYEDNGCYPVDSVNASDIDSNSITLTWLDDMNSGISYTVSYWAAGGDTVVVTGVSETTYTATELGGNTVYNFIITPNCPTGDGIPSTAQFRTACGTTAIPYVEDFESHTSGDAPSCWFFLFYLLCIYFINIF